MRSSGSTWKASGRAWAAAKGPGLKESQTAQLCCLIPEVPGVLRSCQCRAQGPPTLPSRLWPHSHCPREISSDFQARLIIWNTVFHSGLTQPLGKVPNWAATTLLPGAEEQGKRGELFKK